MSSVPGPVPAAVPERQGLWERSDRGWHVAFVLFAAACAFFVVRGTGLPGTQGPALALVAALVLLYALTGARVLSSDYGTRLGWSYVLVAVPLVLTLFAVTTVGGIMLFAVFAHIWRLLPTRLAVGTTVITTLAIAAIRLVQSGGLTSAAAPAVIASLGAGTVGAILLGIWITRIGLQSQKRAELLVELEATRGELAAANRDVGALAERERLSREIHDTLAQGFTSILLLAQAADTAGADNRLRRIEQTARENLTESRALVAALSPAQLDAATLPAALRRLVERVGDELGVAATMDVEGQERPLPATHDVVLLRVSQEALANVRKHAGAETVAVSLRFDDDAVALRISDDGRGFDPTTIRAHGFGMSSMHDRVREIGGTLAVHAAPGAGTRVEVRLAA